MVCEMETDPVEEMDVEALSSMWPEDINEVGKQFNIEKPGADQDMLEEVTINDSEPTVVDFKRLLELTNYSEKGSSQLAYLVKDWEYKQANAVRLLKEELDNLSKQQQEVELKKLEILEEHRFEDERYGGDKRPISILDENLKYKHQHAPRRKIDVVIQDQTIEIDAEYGSIRYWKQRAMHTEKLLEESIHREQLLREKLQESIEHLERQSSPVEELSQILKRADNFLHFVLQNAPVVIGHQDKELRYRFIYNHFPSLHEKDIIGKTDVEIFSGPGVKESQDFKKEVLERGLPAKREIVFETELFGSKTFLIYVEPVFSKTGETIGVNYMGMDVTDQVKRREKMAKLREEKAVQKARETELNKTIHITEETMRAKQMLATMSHEIRSPLSGVVSMTEILSTTKLDKEQRQLVSVMLSSGDLVLQLINDILDLSKVESGVMKLEATKFRPREVVKHVLQTAAASLQKMLTLEGHVADDVPVEVIGDVLRIRQILTNLISNAIKFTHEGKVGIKLYVVSDPSQLKCCFPQVNLLNQSEVPSSKQTEDRYSSMNVNKNEGSNGHLDGRGTHVNHSVKDESCSATTNGSSALEGTQHHCNEQETTIWLRCDVYDSGIGIPENALSSLFKRYMQVGPDTARKYGGTGLGLAICKQLVELMGGDLTVISKEHHGSTFTFILPCKVSALCDSSDDSDELSDLANSDIQGDEDDDDARCGFFQFQPRTLGSLFPSHGSGRTQISSPSSCGFGALSSAGFPEDSHSFPTNNDASKEACSIEDSCSVDAVDTSSENEISPRHMPDTQSTCTESTDKHGQNGTVCNSQNPYMYPVDYLRNTKNQSESSGTRRVPEICQTLDLSSRASSCSSSNNPDAPKLVATPKILLVEDNKINVMVAKSMLKQLGHDIDVVNDGAEAIRAVQRKTYNLVLMDVCMPVMDGLQATRLIRSFEENGNWNAAVDAGIKLEASDSQGLGLSTKRLPIIAMTANALSESAEECFANGMDSFVSKPVTFQSLKQCLKQYLPS
ncbi:hypothetical protein Leryth_012687 [Lithospermum erythrorhizon]|nr:hypothetical protein Leryth_012687 [Lithospermum erythrorhizon]